MTRLSPIYTCDVLTFLRYDQLQQMRLVSRSLNSTIVAHPVRLKARRRIAQLLVFADSPRAQWLARDGYFGRGWKQVQEDWGCCDELKAIASSLAGERIFPVREAGDMGAISMSTGKEEEGGKCIALTCRNEMTAETAAFDVLHFFDHLLRDAVIERLVLLEPSALNPFLFRLLSDDQEGDFKLRCYCYILNPSTAEALVARRTAHVSAVTELYCGTGLPLAEGVDFALRGKPHCKRLVAFEALG